jgi:predicted acyltransferase
LAKFQKWLFPLLVIGANSIVAYVMSWVLEAPVHEALLRHFGETPFRVLDGVASDGQSVSLEPMLLGAATLTIFWLILYWLYRNRIFVRI